jgi:glucan phosphoethanolaminetransferase (alkaline phosphatase superfamily)
MGTHLSIDWIRTYGRIDQTPGVVWESMAQDVGGSYSAIWLGIFIIAFVPIALIVRKRLRYRFSPKITRLLLAGSALLFFVLPIIFWTLVPGGSLRRDKVKPPIVLLYHNILDLLEPQREFPNIDQHIATYQTWWLEGDPTGHWTFNDPDYPLRKTYTGPPVQLDKAQRPNFVFIQLETFRAWNMKLYNPDQALVTTPYMDGMSTSKQGAYWVRSLCNGIPTIYATMAIHTGMFPHSRRRTATAFTQVTLEGFPDFLRKHGYKTALFTGSDPDWDNQRYWYSRWYDRVYFDPAHDEIDRSLFREAARQIRTDIAPHEPFMATVVSITNHTPFQSPEPNLDVTQETAASKRIQNTMRYSDDVVRELIESFRGEPWFERTVFIITGDHAFDLGERGPQLGHSNLRHESTWVPMIIWGEDPRLPRGRRMAVASHVDIAPTILELAGITDKNSFAGHSLLHPSVKQSSAFSVRMENYAYESPTHSSYFPKHGEPMLFAADDLLQQTDITSGNEAIIARMQEIVTALSQVTDYATEYNKVAPAQ